MRGYVLSSEIDCHDFMEQVDAFIDGELGMAEHSSMEAHSRVCGACNDKEARRRNTRQRLRATANSFQPHSDFMDRLRTSLQEQSGPPTAEETGEHSAVVPAQIATPPPAQRPNLLSARLVSHWKEIGLAAAAIIAVGVAFGLAKPHQHLQETSSAVAGVSSFASPIVDESVAWHRKNVPVEVVGPDPSTVRRWFADKVSFALNVPDLGDHARLLGGRLSHVRQYEAAYLLYEVDGSKMSVMAFDAGKLPTGLELNHKTFIDNSNGYNVAIRDRDGVTYTFTSDLDADHLEALVDASMDR